MSPLKRVQTSYGKKINNSGLVFSFKNRLPDANGNVSPQSNDYTLEQIDRTNSKLKDISNVNYDIPNPNYNSSIPDSVEKFYAIQNGYIIKYLSSPTDAQPEGFYAVPDETGTPPTGSTNIEKNITNSQIAPSTTNDNKADVDQVKFVEYDGTNVASPGKNLPGYLSEYLNSTGGTLTGDLNLNVVHSMIFHPLEV